MKTKVLRSTFITFTITKKLSKCLLGLFLCSLIGCASEPEPQPSDNKPVVSTPTPPKKIEMNDLKREGFKGNIKLIIDSIYNPDNSCKMVLNNAYNEDGWITQTDLFFLETGQHQRHIYTIKDSVINAKEQLLDGNNIAMENTYSINVNPDGTQSGAVNKLGAIKIINDANGFWIKKAHAAGQICEELRTVDANGYPIEQITKYWDKLRQDCEGRVVTATYENNEHGNATQQKRLDSKTGKSLIALFEYEYDAQNNWVKQVTMDGEKTIQYTTHRTIEYYQD